MGTLRSLNERLSGWRLYLLSLLAFVPDLFDLALALLDSFTGFDWAALLPPGYEGYGTRIGTVLLAVRLAAHPILAHRRGRRRRRRPRPAPAPEE